MRTWKEKILAVVTGRNDRGLALWYSHYKIKELIAQSEGIEFSDMHHSISTHLLSLVRSGHLERTYKPPHLSRKLHPGKEYLYRWTRKPFKRYVRDVNEAIGQDIWREHPKLPKWFRRMML
jgi:hypothetical protein